jgi:hypothetical protein
VEGDGLVDSMLIDLWEIGGEAHALPFCYETRRLLVFFLRLLHSIDRAVAEYSVEPAYRRFPLPRAKRV